MRLIDAEAFDDKLTNLYKELAEESTNDEHYMFTADGIVDAQLLLDDMPTIDAVQVIRCKDCIYLSGDCFCCCDDDNPTWTQADGFCHEAKRRER